MSRSKFPEPRRLAVRAFAEDGAVLEGELEQAQLPRLRESLLVTDLAPPPVRWHAKGEQRPVAGAAPQSWIALQASTSVTLTCQRCLQPMTQALEIDRRFRFVEGEEEAARLDEEAEDDVLACGRWFDLLELLEDELILALPIVPRHADCPQPLAAPVESPEDARPNPFAALAALRRPPGS